MSGQPLLEVKDLRVEFRNRRGTLVALDGVSFSVQSGEVLGLVGESGAGKSMVGNAILGLLEKPGRITKGQIILDGRRLDQLSEEDMSGLRGKVVSSIFQDPLTSLNPLFTIGDQLVETIRQHLAVSHEKAIEMAKTQLMQSGISAPEKRLNQYPHQFSGGMRQRVVIALALATSPKLLIADEPTTALDVSVQAQIIQLLKKLCKERGTSIILITHDIGVIAEIADRVGVMYAGHLVELGRTKEVIHDAKHPYTRGLMGAIPKIGVQEEFLLQIPGTMPPLHAIPKGCAFHPRCPLAQQCCTEKKPTPTQCGQSTVSCWRAGEEVDFKKLFSGPVFKVRG